MNFEQLYRALKLKSDLKQTQQLLAYDREQAKIHDQKCVEHTLAINRIKNELKKLGVTNETD